MNVVMNSNGGIIEIQGTAEGKDFSEEEFAKMLGLAKKRYQGDFYNSILIYKSCNPKTFNLLIEKLESIYKGINFYK